MLKTARQVLSLFTPAERRRLLRVFAAIMAMGVLQLVGVGSVLPFVSLLTNKAVIHTNPVLSWTYTTLGFHSTTAFLIFAGFVVLTLLVASNIFIAFTLWLIAHFAWDAQHRLSTRLLTGYLAQPYEAFLGRNSADTGKNILIESQQLTNGVLIPGMNALAFGITALFIIGFLFWLSPVLALLVGLTFGLGYGAIYLFVRKPLARIGETRIRANTERFKAVNEAFGSIKEVKVLGRAETLVGNYDPPAGTFAQSMASSQVLGQLPRYAIEALAFGFVISLFLFLLYTRGSVQSILPLAGAFAVAGYRMLPALQQVYNGVSQIRFNRTVLETLERDLAKAREASGKTNQGQTGQPGKIQKLTFKQELRLDSVDYTYPGAHRPALDNISLSIPRNTFVALIGSTGAGKTTLADVILGLLPPQQGSISVDETPLTEHNMRRWQVNLGYVPQEIYLSDDTVAANIAYGLPSERIDMAAVERAARIASIDEFIIQELPDGYQTFVGERGVRLSGGQRQRIGIARAMYHDPGVLVLDEATSALDNETERRIVEELDAMRGGRTLIVIAHRLSTVRRCHKLYLLKHGSLAASGSYEELLSTSADFQRLAKHSDAAAPSSVRQHTAG